ncbi:amine oxidase catalytic domain-containing protein [Sistotremastrum niveocremeum HHB9708]|uniref:Amine oxidase n=1 Tax=Sistotremastrum niveocremeum HHB9708 TaxID=1314777 RepID=A0A165AFR2_9AGAM|nr:amine oxidase catalytic domain-containing protein [Sistotremastrum niveocremeum HHB9708]
MSSISREGYEPLKTIEKEVEESVSPQRRKLGLPSIHVVLLYATLLAGIFLYSRPTRDTTFAEQSTSTSSLEQCMDTSPIPAKINKENLWASLSVPEAVQIRSWLSKEERGFNLTSSDVADFNENYIYLIEAYRPPKSEALAYLDEEAKAPQRYARATIHHGYMDPPTIKDYIIGPLPISKETSLRELTEIYHRDIPFNARGFARAAEMTGFILNFTAPLAEVTQDIFGGVALGLPNDTLVAGMSGPFSYDGSFRRMWMTWRVSAPGPWLHPLNFFQYIDVSGTDRSQWKVLKVVYNYQVFDSIDDFIGAWRNKTLERIPYPEQGDRSWSTRKRLTSYPRELDDRAGPRSVSFNGLRFKVDREKQFVTWMGWQMFLGFDRDMGLSLWDIRFRGERIVYELVPQEAMAQYAGNDPFQATTAWLDRYFGMGSSVRDMLPGYDCPHESVYLPAVVHTPSGSLTRERAICVFEQDSGRPLTRHMGYLEGEFGAVKGYILTVRSIATVGNYDYIFDYMFQLDGTLEVRVSASGYLQGGYWDERQLGYGARIRNTTMGSLHDHVINFKVDLDVAGLKNSLLNTSTSIQQVEQPWFDEDWGNIVTQQYITREFIDNEDNAKLKYPQNFQGGYSFVNRKRKNAWGIERGYSIHPGLSPIHNTVVGSKRLENNANWARYNLAVTKRKETEPSSSSMWNMNLPGNPVVDFHKFFDGESLDQEDLVAWINVGMHHLPQAEDAPNTRTNLAASSFYLTPLNYFDSDVSMEAANAILLSHPKTLGGEFEYDDYNVKAKYCSPPPLPPFDYSGLNIYDLKGEKTEALLAEELRKEAELYHRIMLEA